ncbi:bis(5'-nucleosyl)-tetraphosphatase (symmetrical) YqeK [Candidatus Margulisiibacteriota bacterium]
MKHAQDKIKHFKKLQYKLGHLLPKDRFRHSKRVAKLAENLAKHYRVDIFKAKTAALLHDCSRFLIPGQMLTKARALGYKIGKIEEFEPKLLHADLSAYYAKKKFGIKDKGILRAIRSHTVGSARMSLLDKVVYLADHIEENRNFKGVAEVKRKAYKDIDQAVIGSLGIMINHLTKIGHPLHQLTIKSRNNLILKRK